MRFLIYLVPLAFTFSCTVVQAQENKNATIVLEEAFRNPPIESRLRAYWWWLNANVTKKAITRDLEEMKAAGFGGAVLCDVDRSYPRGHRQVPHGPDFMSTEWRELYKHTLKEAQRLGLEISLNITSGWALGGPMIKKEDAPKILVWSRDTVKGPNTINQKISTPKFSKFISKPHRAHEKPENVELDSLYRDILIIAYPKYQTSIIENWEVKTLHKPLHSSAPATKILYSEKVLDKKERAVKKEEIIDLTDNLTRDGFLEWDIPDGEWNILRLGYTIYSKGMKWASSEGWGGFPLDPFNANIFNQYWDEVVNPLIEDASELAGTTLKYLHTDSWELEPINWTSTFREEFLNRRGYDLLPYAPALTGCTVENQEISNRFLNDFRKTLGDLTIDNHYRIFKERAHQKGLLIHPESGGPHAVPIDAQRCLGFNDLPMSEFWAKANTHRVTQEHRFFVKQPASAAHTYGKKIVMAEGFTTVGPHWQETIWDNLKPTFDQAACEGMNLLVWHTFTCSPEEMGIPGQVGFAGTHLNPNTTWWKKSNAFLSYINRCQVMLQHGLFTADVAYYYGDHIPNFAQLKSSDPCDILPGYDYDVVNEEVILERMDVFDGKIILPDGMTYKLLVLPEYPGFSLKVLKKIKTLLLKGAIVVGPKPRYMNSLSNFIEADSEFRDLIMELWGKTYSNNHVTERRIGKGILFSGIEVRNVLKKLEIKEDFSYSTHHKNSRIDYIHRSNSSIDIYFISNQSESTEKILCDFRVSGKQPEFWDAISGEIWDATEWWIEDDRTYVPIELAPYGSIFTVFATSKTPPKKNEIYNNFIELDTLYHVGGDWEVSFDKKWGGPESIIFNQLISWTEHEDFGIKYYSGTATYRKNFTFMENKHHINTRYFIDLGDVKELAEVRLNGKSLGIVWSPPFKVEVTNDMLLGKNELEIDVVNFWSNRIIGDQFVPDSERYTQTNITSFSKETPLSISGLIGPVTLLKSTNRKQHKND